MEACDPGRVEVCRVFRPQIKGFKILFVDLKSLVDNKTKLSGLGPKGMGRVLCRRNKTIVP